MKTLNISNENIAYSLNLETLNMKHETHTTLDAQNICEHASVCRKCKLKTNM